MTSSECGPSTNFHLLCRLFVTALMSASNSVLSVQLFRAFQRLAGSYIEHSRLHTRTHIITIPFQHHQAECSREPFRTARRNLRCRPNTVSDATVTSLTNGLKPFAFHGYRQSSPQTSKTICRHVMIVVRHHHYHPQHVPQIVTN